MRATGRNLIVVYLGTKTLPQVPCSIDIQGCKAERIAFVSALVA